VRVPVLSGTALRDRVFPHKLSNMQNFGKNAVKFALDSPLQPAFVLCGVDRAGRWWYLHCI